MKVKVKFYECPEEATLKIAFIKKSGDIKAFYDVLKDLQELLNEHLVTRVD